MQYSMAETWKTMSFQLCSLVVSRRMAVLVPTFLLTGLMQAFQSALLT